MNKPMPMRAGSMPDIANRELAETKGTLDWVGMSDVHQPLKVKDGDEIKEVQAKVQIYVDLSDPLAKGIHMSRLYLLLDEHSNTRPLTASGLKMLLSTILESHHDLSTRAFVEFSFDHFIRRKALLSENFGWSSYPVTVKGTLMDGEVHLELSAEIQYSSTCPCSAALSRQLIQSKFQSDFGGEGTVELAEMEAWLGREESIVATPHSQRSTAKVMVRLNSSVEHLPISDLVDSVEAVLKTPVQSAVKREDEQEFARLNGSNLMFVEDSGRRIKKGLSEESRYEDFWVRIEHHESLHAHDAVGVVTKGIEGGYLPIP